MLKQDSYVQAKLVEMGWRWSQAYTGGHISGQLVMQTLANRVRCGWGSWLQIIDGVPKFMAENEMPKLEHGSIWQPEFVKLLHAVEGIHNGSVQDLTHGALYFADLNHIERPWFMDKIIQARDEDGVPQHKRVTDMGSFCFWS